MVEKTDFLLEIGCEEVPSRFIPGAMQQLEQEAAALLEENRLNYKRLQTWATPRRLVLLVSALDDNQADLVEKVKGPPVNRAYDEEGKPTKALEGFLRSQGVSVEALEEEVIKEARYIVVSKETPGRKALELLPGLLPQLIRKLAFPRPMYWSRKEVRFARPIRWLLALYGNSPVEFGFADVEAGDLTYGHRFLAPGPFKIDSVKKYFQTLEDNYIVVDHERRRAMIREQLEAKAEEIGGKALIDDALLEEVTYLVEYPVAVDGSFDRAYLDLPQEVPITSMQNHQRYFPLVEKESGRLLPNFVGISNNRFHENIRKGYAKVLQARLADGRFFYNEDRKMPLEDYIKKLESVVFLQSLGSLDQKRARLVELVGRLGRAAGLSAEDIDAARRVAHLCKADLVTNMVKEFPELQGVMGREYARLSGESEDVAVGIYEHYLPRQAGDAIPSGMAGALVSLADRIDTLGGCFATGIQPTGSQDPFALRRQAAGAVAILLGLKLELSLEEYIDHALDVLVMTLDVVEDETAVRAALLDFLLQRVRFALQEKEFGHDVVEAALAVPFKSLVELTEKASALSERLQTPLLADIIIAYNRVANLARKSSTHGRIDEALFESEAERELYRLLLETETTLGGTNDPVRRLEQLRLMRKPIDDFFDHVMVMVEQEDIRTNRLNLLARIKAVFNRVADFSILPTP